MAVRRNDDLTARPGFSVRSSRTGTVNLTQVVSRCGCGVVASPVVISGTIVLYSRRAPRGTCCVRRGRFGRHDLAASITRTATSKLGGETEPEHHLWAVLVRLQWLEHWPLRES